jgi:hypothetical protein
MEKEIKQVSEQDYINMKSVENSAYLLRCIAQAMQQSTHAKDKLFVRNPHNPDELEKLGKNPTFALTIEGYLAGASNELCQAELGEVVEGIMQRHGILFERIETGGE